MKNTVSIKKIMQKHKLLMNKLNLKDEKMKKIHINNDDNYATPPKFYKKLDEIYNFDFDPCPYAENEVIVDGLTIEWGQQNFVNPPYSLKLKEAFVKKGIDQMKKGKVCVFLIPVSTSTVLFHKYIKPNATKIEFIEGRIKFGKLDKDGDFYLPLKEYKNKAGETKHKTQSGTKDSMIVVFDGRENKDETAQCPICESFKTQLIYAEYYHECDNCNESFKIEC